LKQWKKPLKSMQPATQTPKKSRALRAQVMQPSVAPAAPELFRLSFFSNLVTLALGNFSFDLNLILRDKE
jgi:hypothetical protein